MKSADVKDNVAFILEHNQFSRDDDNTLIFLYWMKFDGLNEEKLLKISEKFVHPYAQYLNLASLNLTSTDTIKQARRDLQKEGKFRASSEAISRRTKKFLDKRN